jgi:beta-lactamase superfamily II metal-dependent hydrolase
MNKKLLIALSLMLVLILALAGCGKDKGKKPDGGESVEIPETYVELVKDGQANAVVVRPDSPKGSEKELAQEIKNTLTDKLGVNVPITTDWGFDASKYPEGAFIISVGKTELKETADFLADKDYAMCAVTVTGNTVIVTATEPVYLESAVKEFWKAVVELNGVYYLDTALLNYDSGKIVTTTIIENKKTEYKIVYEIQKDESDYPKILAQRLANGFGTDYKVTVPIVEAFSGNNAKEIVIGICSQRPMTTALEQSLGYNEYAIHMAENGNITICGKNYEMTQRAIDKFLEIASSFKDSGKFEFASVLSGKYVDESLPTIPVYKEGPDYDLISNVLNGYTVYHVGETVEAYNAYVSKLEGAGYKKVASTEIKNNVFATLENDDAIINCYFTGATKSVKICVDSKETTTVHNYKPESVNAVTTPMLIQFTTGCGYIIRLEDGTFVVFDSGHTTEIIYKNLYNYLKQYNVLEGKPHIRAWIFGHPHVDHLGGFFNFSDHYANEVTVDQIIYNNPTRAHYHDTIDDPPEGDQILEDRIMKFIKYCDQYYSKADIVTAHTGQIMYFGNTKAEILHTYEDDYPTHVVAGNQISVLVRFTFGDQTLLLTSDMHQNSAPYIVAMFGDHLRSDILQIPHHGYNGGTPECYNAVQASVIMYTNDLAGFNANRGKNNTDVAIRLAKMVLVPTDMNDMPYFELPFAMSSGNKWNRK